MATLTRKSVKYAPSKPSRVVDWRLDGCDRQEQRRALAEKWLEESEYTNYRYNVETCSDGTKVYLLRPTWLNKGFDFQVNLEGFRSATRSARGQTREMPSHDDVLHDVRAKLAAHAELTADLYGAICEVYECQDTRKILMNRPTVAGLSVGLPAEKLLLIIKWLFIEQDLTYWLQTGRNMLMSAIETKAFKIQT